MCDANICAQSEALLKTLNSFNDEDKSQLYIRSRARLCDLPVEIFVHICSYLDAKFVSEVLRNVCMRFFNILSDDTLWRIFVSHRSNLYPVLASIENSENFSWERACVELDEENNIWRNEPNLFTTILKDVHYASVDTVLLMKEGRICVSGSRDRNIAVWNLEEICNTQTSVTNQSACLQPNAHAGWIWDLTSNDRYLYSGAWDNTVKSWNLDTGLTCIETAECKRVVLSLVCDNEIVVAGLHSGYVMLLDSRSITKEIQKYKTHTGSVLSVAMSNDYIISASEDRTIAVWDRRAGKSIKKDLKITNTIQSLPMHLSFAAGCIFIGDSKNNIYVCDPQDFSIRPFYTVDEDDSIRLAKSSGIRNNYGSVIASFNDGSIHVFQPTSPYTEITKFRSTMSEVLSLDYQASVLAAGGESAVQVWIPQNSSILH